MVKPLPKPLMTSGKCSGFSGKEWLRAEAQKQVENAGFCVLGRRETQVERVEWL